MRKLVLVATMVAAFGFGDVASADWTCSVNARPTGRPTGRCITTVDAGSYVLTLRSTDRVIATDVDVQITTAGSMRCFVVASAFSCEGTGGTVTSGPMGASFAFQVTEQVTLDFGARPPFCGTVTCGRDPTFSSGDIVGTLSAVA